MDDLEQQIVQEAAIFNEEYDGLDEQEALNRVLDFVHGRPDSKAAGAALVVGGGRLSATAPGGQELADHAAELEGQERWEDAGLVYRWLAHSGEAWAARRWAELLELLYREEEAQIWWRRAAQGGDPDAQDHWPVIIRPGQAKDRSKERCGPQALRNAWRLGAAER